MKKTLTKNLGLKLLSLGVSILIWMVVIANENPVTTKTFNNIPVTILKSEIVTNEGNTFQVLNGTNMISVSVTAKSSVLSRITSNDVKAVADMSNLDVYSRMLVPIDVSIPGFAVSEVEANPTNLQVKIEMETTKSFPITATSSGTPRDGYFVGKLTVDPKQIEISGPESIVDTIAEVTAAVDVTGLSKDTNESAVIAIYDHNGKVIDQTLIQHNLGEDGVSVAVSIYETKTVPINFDASMIRTASGYVLDEVVIEPKSISIIGAKEDLDILESIDIPPIALKKTGLSKTTEMTIDITPYLPSWCKQKEENSETLVLAKIYVTKAGTKTFEFPTGAISLVNAPKGYKISYNGVKNIEITVKGTNDVLPNLELNQGSVSLNLINVKEEGTYTLPLQVTLEDNLELDKEIKVMITVEKSEETDE